MLNLRSLAQSKNRLLAHKSGIVRVDATSSVVYCPFRKVSHLCNRERVHSLLIARGTYRARKGRESEEMCRWGPVLVSVSRRIYLPKVQRNITSSPEKHVLARYCVFILRRAKACNLTDAHSPHPTQTRRLSTVGIRDGKQSDLKPAFFWSYLAFRQHSREHKTRPLDYTVGRDCIDARWQEGEA